MSAELMRLAKQAGFEVVTPQRQTAPIVRLMHSNGRWADISSKLAEFARLVRADMKYKCLSAVRDERLVDAVNCDADHAYNSALRDAEAAIRELKD